MSLESPIRVGDREGRGTVYDPSGELLSPEGETILKRLANWDIDIISPWRRVLPHTIFPGFHNKASSRLFITNHRIVLIREIDEWRELAGELYPLGLPNAAAKDVVLRRMKQEGVRQFCEIWPTRLRLVSVKRITKVGSMVDFRLLGDDGKQYAAMMWKTDGRDEESLDLIESRFKL